MQCFLLGLLNLTRSPQLFNIFDTLSARRWYQQPFPITEMERHRVCEGSLWPWWLCQWHCRDQVWETHSYQGLYYSFTEHRSRILRFFFVICEIFRILYRFGFEIIHSLVFSFPELQKVVFFLHTQELRYFDILFCRREWSTHCAWRTMAVCGH